jgi:WD40 repeat protein
VWCAADARRGVATQLARLTGHGDVVYALQLGFGALFSSSADKTIRRYDVRGEHAETLSWDAHNHSITCMACAERLELLCSGAEDGRICLWKVGADAATCSGTFTIRPAHHHASNLAIYALAVDPVSGDVLFSGGADYRVHMFDLRARTLLHTLCGHTSTVRALCFTPDTNLLCSSGGDFNLSVWSLGGSPQRRTTRDTPHSVDL